MKMKMMVGLVVAIAAVTMFSSYVGADQMSPEEIKDLVFANATEIDTFKYDYKVAMNTTMEMLIDNETGVVEVTTIKNGSCVVKHIDEIATTGTMTMTMTMNWSINKNTTGKMVEIVPGEKGLYLSINDSMYTEVNLSNSDLSALLHTMGSPESYEHFWEYHDLLNISEVELLEDEMIDDVNCSVLKIVPDTGKFWEIVINQSEWYEELQDLPGFDNQSIKNITTIQWIAKDTGFPLETQTTMRTMASQDAEEEFTMTRDIEMEMRFYDYNEPVSIP